MPLQIFMTIEDSKRMRDGVDGTLDLQVSTQLVCFNWTHLTACLDG